jgi:protoporphyrinogen oxidase
MPKTEDKIIIMGGGLAGLAAGYELSHAGKKVVIIEKWEDVGGLARTLEVNGFRFDTGPHRWYTKSNMVNEWMLDLLGDEVIKVPRLTRIYFDHQFFYYPIKLQNALNGIGIGRAIMSVVDYIIARLKSRLFKPVLKTMEDGYINQFGKTLYETFFKRYSEKLWGVDCTEISIDWVGQRTRGLNILTIIKSAFIKSKDVVSLIDEFSFPKNGIGRIADKLVEGIKKKGGEVMLDTEVIQVNHDKKTITSVIVKTAKGKKEITGSHFISSIPLNDLVMAIAPRVDKEIVKLSDKLTYRDELQVALFIKKTHITPDTWIYVHPKEIPFMRVMEMDNWSDIMSPKGTTTLVFEIACNEGDSWWIKKDKEIIDLVSRSFVDEFKLVERKDIIDGFVHRVPKEYPVYHIGYKEDVDEIKRYMKRFTNLQLIGRNGTFRYNNMDHSIEMGLYAAWNIIEQKEKYDIESVNIEREYLEEKKIENLEDETVEVPAVTS